MTAVTAQPARYLVNTHFHRDHTGGNELFAKDGAVIVAHENVKRVLASGSTNGLNCAVTPPVPAGSARSTKPATLAWIALSPSRSCPRPILS